MIVYHGSIITVDSPDVQHSYRPLDFGKGFYVTSVREQAERWARRKKSKSILHMIRLRLLRRKPSIGCWYLSLFGRCKR